MMQQGEKGKDCESNSRKRFISTEEKGDKVQKAFMEEKEIDGEKNRYKARKSKKRFFSFVCFTNVDVIEAMMFRQLV